MKSDRLIHILSLLLTLFSAISCKKDTPADPDQSLIEQMKSVTDSIIQNTHVPGIVALVADHKRKYLIR